MVCFRAAAFALTQSVTVPPRSPRTSITTQRVTPLASSSLRRPIPLSPLGTVRQLSKITISLARLRCRMLTTLIPVSPRRLSTTEMKFFSLQVRLPQKATPRQIILPRLNRATPPLGPARMSRDPAALSRAIRHFAAQRRAASPSRRKAPVSWPLIPPDRSHVQAVELGTPVRIIWVGEAARNRLRQAAFRQTFSNSIA